jgi:molybdopterin-guanine dinucleotide biosynthesis protein A/nucleoside-triphosphatase THEP1
MKGEIFILSAPIRVGKTSLIKQFIENNREIQVGGFLTPESTTDGRKLWDAQSKIYHRLQVQEDEISPEHQETVGRFVFDKRAWEKAMMSLGHQWEKDYIVIDEIGKLEVNQNRGIHDALSSFLIEYQSKQKRPHLVLIIRNTLLSEAIKKYHLQDAIINNGPWFNEDAALMGLLIAGGQSSRMGKDKALIEYHSMPQWEYVEQQLSQFCTTTIINRNDARFLNKNLMIDSAEFSGHGPISGLLTAVSEHPDQSIFVMGIDYPMLRAKTLDDLVQTYRIRNQSVCFKNPTSDILEPLCAIYHSSDLRHIFDWFNNGNDSLSKFLASRNPVILKPNNIEELKSFDTPHDQIQYRAR